MVLNFFLVLAGLFLASTVGYLLLLSGLALLRRQNPPWTGALPKIAVILPARNEAEHIGDKLADLARQTYPAELMRILVADGGSEDGTRERLKEALASHPRVEVLHLPEARGKSEQMNAALALVGEEIAVFSAADSRLDPDCLRFLIEDLLGDPRAAVAGAWTTPLSPLAEERLHWAVLNRLWRLEGLALGAAKATAVCLACRRSMVSPIPPEVRGDDAHLALKAIVNGHRVLLSRRARALEKRAPGDIQELLGFRQKRGLAYLSELDRLKGELLRSGPTGWACLVSWWHFRVTPLMLLAMSFLAVFLWPLPSLSLLGGAALATAAGLALNCRPAWRNYFLWLCLPAASLRWAALTFFAMVALQGRKPQPLHHREHIHETGKSTTRRQISGP